MYTPWAIDPNKLESTLESCARSQESKTRMDIAKSQSFLDGYRSAMDEVRKYIHSINCEKEKQEEQNG